MVELTYLFVAVLAVASLVEANRFCQLPTCDWEEHTMCRFPSPQPARQCVAYKSASLTPEEKKEILYAHNTFRARVASGRETRGLGGPQPVGNIPPLQWDEELAQIAQRWANQCNFGHDKCRNVDRFRVGQNVAYKGWSDGYNTKLTELVTMWYDEVEHFDRSLISSFQFHTKIGHYTQMVWGKTTTVGCGLVRYKKDDMFTTYLVCNYGERGNMENEPIYETR
ncbi:venom allergen 5 [Diachasma alloeum]|uniref:venom allergen 5 n=1 Tax=Diachasma alloeum TaxID=454923 RepID=UPI0007382FE6|nr:venom allergen 5 [Diachasma alloeum]